MIDETSPASSLMLFGALEIKIDDDWHQVTKLVRRIAVTATDTSEGSSTTSQEVESVTVTYGGEDTEVVYAGSDTVTTRLG